MNPSSFLILDRIPVLTEVDILVIGAGSAGCCAALAARESHAHSVLLVERHGFLGGISTQALDTFYGFFTPGEQPKKVAGGIPDRVVDRLDNVGEIFLRPNTYGAGTGVNYNPERLKLVWDEMMAAAGVDVLLHTSLIAVEQAEAGRLRSVVVSTRGGFYRIRARRFIDTSGDAELCHLAEIPYEKAGEQEPAQTLTTTFRMSNVDLDRFEQAGGKRVLMERMEEALARGTHPLPRKAGSAHRMCQKGCISTVAVRVGGIDPQTPGEITRAEQEGRRQAFIYERFFQDCVPGYEESSIIGLSHQIGIRETRRVFGAYRLTREDCLSARKFDDRIAICGAPIEDHRITPDGGDETEWAYVPDGETYDIPYRTLTPPSAENVWVAGRCFSATHSAHASCRSMAQTMSMGQAVGIAAAMSLEFNYGTTEVDAKELHQRLRALGGILESPERNAHIQPDGWKHNR